MEEEPRYTLRIRTNERDVEINVSTAQVQFWPDYVDRFFDSIEDVVERQRSRIVLARVDLFTNEYHSDHVRRLDNKSHGPMMNAALDLL
jgi:hypothetical protein